MGGVLRGHLVLADISGYTAFVADTELEHSREILNELLETLVRGLAQHLRIGQIEGDAIFALGETVPEDRVLTTADIRDGAILLRAGKKKYARLVPR